MKIQDTVTEETEQQLVNITILPVTADVTSLLLGQSSRVDQKDQSTQ